MVDSDWTGPGKTNGAPAIVVDSYWTRHGKKGGAPAVEAESERAGRGQMCVAGFVFGCSCSEGNPPTLPAFLEEDCKTSAWMFQRVRCMTSES